jgi:peptidoglycan-N-acetylglucosamine deacetylase
MKCTMPERERSQTGPIWLALVALLLCSACAGRAAHPGSHQGGKDPRGPHEPLKPLELAITVDDLPVHGDTPPGMDRIEIAAKMIAALHAADAGDVYGFGNGEPLEWDPAWREVFHAWRQAGYRLGNHTYSHKDLGQVPVEEFLADVEKMDQAMDSLSPGANGVKMFRYPYLSEGNTLEKRNRVRDYLSRKGYRIAQVTVDYEDWAWTNAYARCAAKNDEQAIRWLRTHVVKAARRQLLHAQRLARLLMGRDIKHILLIHVGAFTTLSAQDVLASFKTDGVRFISLQAALEDPVYGINPGLPMPDGRNFLEQLAAMKGVEDPYGDEAEDAYKKERLEKLCVQ